MSVFVDQTAFMVACGQTVNQQNPEQFELYSRLIDEELGELLEARNDVERFDAILDLIVVCIGAGLSMGYPMQRGWDEVVRSNLAKIDPATGKVRKREDGKVLKPEGWTPPDLERVLGGV